MPENPDLQDHNHKSGVSRRTLVKGAAWAVPAIAVAATVPVASASKLPPCIASISAASGTYPVTVDLSECGARTNNHWDFNFTFTASKNTADCKCDKVRITFYDNPPRSRLILDGFTSGFPSTKNASPKLYVQKELAPGQSQVFPTTGQTVYYAAAWNGHAAGTSTGVTIVDPGGTNDALHTIIDPAGGTGWPCDWIPTANDPMARYTVECFANGVWTLIGTYDLNPCVPMISATACRASRNPTKYTVKASVLNACGIANTNFKVTKIVRNDNSNDPFTGTTVWTGTQALGTNPTPITTNSGGSGDNLWLYFNTGGVTSQIRVDISDVSNC